MLQLADQLHKFIKYSLLIVRRLLAYTGTIATKVFEFVNRGALIGLKDLVFILGIGRNEYENMNWKRHRYGGGQKSS